MLSSLEQYVVDWYQEAVMNTLACILATINSCTEFMMQCWCSVHLVGVCSDSFSSVTFRLLSRQDFRIKKRKKKEKKEEKERKNPRICERNCGFQFVFSPEYYTCLTV